MASTGRLPASNLSGRANLIFYRVLQLGMENKDLLEATNQVMPYGKYKGRQGVGRGCRMGLGGVCGCSLAVSSNYGKLTWQYSLHDKWRPNAAKSGNSRLTGMMIVAGLQVRAYIQADPLVFLSCSASDIFYTITECFAAADNAPRWRRQVSRIQCTLPKRPIPVLHNTGPARASTE